MQYYIVDNCGGTDGTHVLKGVTFGFSNDPKAYITFNPEGTEVRVHGQGQYKGKRVTRVTHCHHPNFDGWDVDWNP